MSRASCNSSSDGRLMPIPSAPSSEDARTSLSKRSAMFSCGFVATRWIGLFLLSSCLQANVTAGDWQTGQGYRWQELKVPGTGRTYLQRLPASATGITFTNYLSEDKALE